MAEWKKTNEAYFGDSFNRDSVLACYDAGSSDYSLTSKGISWNDCISTAASCNNIAFTKSELDGLCSYDNALVMNASIDTVNDKFTDLQAQINDLKKKLEPKKECSELRSALKTLHYNREVE